LLGAGLPACEPHRMAGDVLHRVHDGDEAADQVRGTDHAVVPGIYLGWGSRRMRLQERLHGIDMGFSAAALLRETTANSRETVEQVESRPSFALGAGFTSGLALIAALRLWLPGSRRRLG